ncbi:MAG TPA: Xaa-Pro peptidase family protein [Lacipirellulaceae bacterium]|nr:Xaa-Pro peptidase family protein [Lacipirellulaceae bacterium]
MDDFTLDIEACRGRQRRLLEAIEPLNAELAVLTRRESIQWLTGVHVRAPFEPIAILWPDAHVTLVLPEPQVRDIAAADKVFGYESKWHATTRNEQRAASTAVVLDNLSLAPKQVACEFEAFAPQLLLTWTATLIEIDAIVFELRRRKDHDELRLLAHANEANRGMYQRAREIVRPGANELDIYAELYHVAVQTLGEPPTYFGQDFRSNARGGAPRDRQIQAGELMILDLGVGFRGYHSDNARTIAVNGEPSQHQKRAWQAAADVLEWIQSEARPGVRCRALFDKAQQQLDAFRPCVFDHHLGHGVGLAPQEGPHLNPRWDDVLAEGDFIAVEPGLYGDDLHAGVRLEQNYLVTSTGVQLMTDWPLGL